MKCRICAGKAIIGLPQHNMALCAEHFDNWMLKRVSKAVDEFKMFSKKSNILVAVSYTHLWKSSGHHSCGREFTA